MGLLMSLLVGALVGWLASLLMKTDKQMGTIANIIVGIVGAWLGGVLAGMLGFAAVTTLSSIIVAIAGACVLIALLKALNVFK
ncbi:MAG: GlsB/YeaQ/YmgE family stress response membrane protein [Vicinamibacterales bacterium]